MCILLLQATALGIKERLVLTWWQPEVYCAHRQESSLTQFSSNFLHQARLAGCPYSRATWVQRSFQYSHFTVNILICKDKTQWPVSHHVLQMTKWQITKNIQETQRRAQTRKKQSIC